VFWRRYTVTMVTYYVMKMTITCSPLIGHLFDTITVALTDKKWQYWSVEVTSAGNYWKILRTTLSTKWSVIDVFCVVCNWTQETTSVQSRPTTFNYKQTVQKVRLHHRSRKLTMRGVHILTCSILNILWPRENIRICMKNAANTFNCRKCEIIHNNKWFTLFMCYITCYLMAFWGDLKRFERE